MLDWYRIIGVKIGGGKFEFDSVLLHLSQYSPEKRNRMKYPYAARAARTVITVAAAGAVGATTVDCQRIFKVETAVLKAAAAERI